MSKSNMGYSDKVYGADALILKRLPFEGVPMTLDFTSVVATDDAGNKVVKAGTPIGPNGTADNTGTVVGILLYDVIEKRPQGTLLKKAYIDEDVAKTHSGVTIDSAVKAALPMVVFE